MGSPGTPLTFVDGGGGVSGGVLRLDVELLAGEAGAMDEMLGFAGKFRRLWMFLALWLGSGRL